MKKLIAILLVLAMAVACIACEPNNSKDPNGTDTNSNGTNQSTEEDITPSTGDETTDGTTNGNGGGGFVMGEDTDTRQWGPPSDMTPIY